jgi:hypothetical protein
MNRFASLLREVNNRLNLPQPTKSRILLEMAGDLEDLYNFYRGQGLDENEAVQKAEEKIDASYEALAELVEIHQTSYRKLMEMKLFALFIKKDHRLNKLHANMPTIFTFAALAWFVLRCRLKKLTATTA